MTKSVAVALLLLFSSSAESKASKDFIDKMLDVVIETADNSNVELPGLYDSLVEKLPMGQDERPILAERLKRRGFEVTHSGWGNYPPLGVRIVIVELKRKDCECTVCKIYYVTGLDNMFQRSERISCTRKPQKKLAK